MTEMGEIRHKVDKLGRAWHAFTEENGKGRRSDRGRLSKINGEFDRLSDLFGRL